MGASIMFIIIIPFAILYVIDQQLGTDFEGMLVSYFENNPEFIEQIGSFSIKAFEIYTSVMNFLGLM